MSMGLLALAAALAPAATSAVHLEARNENRIGAIPLGGELGVVYAVGTEVQPGVEGRYDGGDQNARLRYSPQLLINDPLGRHDLLVLHGGSASWALHTSRRWQLGLDFSGTYGELDFFRARQLLDERTRGTVFLTEGETVRYGRGDGTLGLNLRLTERLSTDVRASAGQEEAFKRTRNELVLPDGTIDARPTTQDIFRPQRSLSASVRTRYATSRVDSFAIEIEGSRLTYVDGPYFTGLTPQLAYARRLSARSELTVQAGLLIGDTDFGEYATVNVLLDTDPGAYTALEHERRIMPLASIGWLGPLKVFDQHLSATITAAALTYYNPTRATLEERGRVSATAETPRGSKWTARARAEVYFPLDAELTEPEGHYPPDDSWLVSTSPVVSYILDDVWTAEVGGMLSARYLPSNTERRIQPELAVFLAVGARTRVW